MEDFPKIISVDDHVIEHANVWQDRLPAKYRDIGPRVIQQRGNMNFVGGVFSYEPDENGQLCDWWLYDDLIYPFPKLSAAVGFPELDVTPTTFDEIRPGCWINLLPAGGLLLAPEASSGCSCNFSVQTSLALTPVRK